MIGVPGYDNQYERSGWLLTKYWLGNRNTYQKFNANTRFGRVRCLCGIVRNEADLHHSVPRVPNTVRHAASVPMSKLFVDIFLQSFDSPPEKIVLDVDATDDPRLASSPTPETGVEVFVGRLGARMT